MKIFFEMLSFKCSIMDSIPETLAIGNLQIVIENEKNIIENGRNSKNSILNKYYLWKIDRENKYLLPTQIF